MRGPKLLLFLLITLNACGNSHSARLTAPTDSSALRAVTWNVKQVSRDTVEAQVDLLAGLRPDIVVLQEAYRGEVERYRARLAARTSRSWEARYAPQVRRSDGNQGAGVVILSAFPIAASETLMMAHADQWTSARPALRVRVHPPSLPRGLNIVTTHLAAGENSGEVRARQVAELNAWARQSGAATILGGDLNAEPGSPELRPLESAFADAWALAGAGGGETFSASDPKRRIDYWLAAKGGGVAPSEIAVVEVCRASCLSDHKALLAVFHIGQR